jgi:hypothetical protein
MPAFSIGPKALSGKPEGMWIAEVMSAWPWLEYRLGLSLAYMLGAEPEAGLAMYAALRGSSAQKAALRGVAEERLSPDDWEVFDQLLKATSSVSNERADIVHGLWGLCPQLPGKLIWLDPREMLAANAAHVPAFRVAGVALPYLGFAGNEASKYWTQQEFERLTARIIRLCAQFDQFLRMLVAKSPERDELRSRLMSEFPSDKKQRPTQAASSDTQETPRSPPQSAQIQE